MRPPPVPTSRAIEYEEDSKFSINDYKSRSSYEKNSKRNALYQSKNNLPLKHFRQTPIVRQIVRGFRNNVIGVGADIDFHNGEETARQKLSKDFDKWSGIINGSVTSDFHGDTTFGGIQALIVSTIYNDHGAFVIKYIEDVNGSLELRLRVVGQSWLDKTSRKKDIENGLQTDKHGRVKGYLIYNNVDEIGAGSTLYKKDVEVIHVREIDEAESLLGVSSLIASQKSLTDLVDLNDARITKEVISACMALIVQGVDKDDSISMKRLKDEEEITPGMIAYLEDADANVTSVLPGNTGNQAHETEASLQRNVAIGAGSNYEAATGDYSRVNFASGKSGKQEYKLNINVIQAHTIKPMLNKIVNWWLDLEKIKYPSKKLNAVTTTFNFSDMESISPKEDLDVDIQKVRAGAMSPQDFSRKYGSNLKDVLDAWKEAKKWMEEADVILDTDASKVSSAGNIQVQAEDAEKEKESSKTPATSKEQKKKESKK